MIVLKRMIVANYLHCLQPGAENKQTLFECSMKESF